MTQIDRDRPIPNGAGRIGRRRGRATKYPFGLMEVGDSYVWPREYTREEMRNAYSAANGWAKNYTPRPKFSTSKEEVLHKRTGKVLRELIRIHRIADWANG